jgi:hypothetical protein
VDAWGCADVGVGADEDGDGIPCRNSAESLPPKSCASPPPPRGGAAAVAVAPAAGGVDCASRGGLACETRSTSARAEVEVVSPEEVVGRDPDTGKNCPSVSLQSSMTVSLRD